VSLLGQSSWQRRLHQINDSLLAPAWNQIGTNASHNNNHEEKALIQQQENNGWHVTQAERLVEK
jgi:hypothetical protein